MGLVAEGGQGKYRYYHIMILFYFTVGSTSSGSAFVIVPKLGAKTIFESISLWRWLLPLYFLIRFFDQISLTFVLFKNVTLTWINYLETWLRSDNTSCYYNTVAVVDWLHSIHIERAWVRWNNSLTLHSRDQQYKTLQIYIAQNTEKASVFFRVNECDLQYQKNTSLVCNLCIFRTLRICNSL